MDIKLNIYAIVLLFAFVHGLVYAFLLIRRGWLDERQSDYWLAAFIIAACVFNLDWMLGFMGIHYLGQGGNFLPYSIDLIIGPLILFYLKSQINANFRFKKEDYWHFLPYFLYFTYHIIIFSLGQNTMKWWIDNVHNAFLIYHFEMIGGNILPCVYLILSWRMYQKYVLWLPSERSDTEGVRFAWFRNFMIACALGVISAIIIFILGFWFNLSYLQIWYQRAIVAAVVYYISIAGFAQAQPHKLIFEEKPLDDAVQNAENAALFEPNSIEAPSKPEAKADIPDLDKWKKKVLDLMENQKLYLNAELTLSDVSDKLNSHNSLISNVINTAFDKNFNDFVNEFRVEEFKLKVNNPNMKHYTLLTIAFDCGFNSKSTFNRAVKKVTNRLPSEFMLKEH